MSPYLKDFKAFPPQGGRGLAAGQTDEGGLGELNTSVATLISHPYGRQLPPRRGKAFGRPHGAAPTGNTGSTTQNQRRGQAPALQRCVFRGA